MIAAGWSLLISGFAFVAGAAIGDIFSEEIRTRLDRLPHWLLRQSLRFLPAEERAVRLKETQAELCEILRGAHSLPVTRLVVGIRYAVGWARASIKMSGGAGAWVRRTAAARAAQLGRSWVLAVPTRSLRGRSALLGLVGAGGVGVQTYTHPGDTTNNNILMGSVVIICLMRLWASRTSVREPLRSRRGQKPKLPVD